MHADGALVGRIADYGNQFAHAGAFGLGTIFGPLAAAMFVLPVVGLSGPMFAFALIAAGAFFVFRPA